MEYTSCERVAPRVARNLSISISDEGILSLRCNLVIRQKAGRGIQS